MWAGVGKMLGALLPDLFNWIGDKVGSLWRSVSSWIGSWFEAKKDDSDLKKASRRYRDAQEKLQKAMDAGKSKEEIKELNREANQAFRDFMRHRPNKY